MTLEFDPSSLLITNQLAPIAINLFPAPKQTLWLYNPYLNDIKLRLISGSVELALANDELVVKSHQHSPLILTFTPNYVGSYEVHVNSINRFINTAFHYAQPFQLEIEIVFNGCQSSMKIYGECTGRVEDLLENFRNNSPNYDLNSKLNPFVLHGSNICTILPQHGCSSVLIALQNNSKNCIKYEWNDFQVSEFLCEVCVEPRSGYLKSGCTKLFRVLVNSFGANMIMPTIPIKCSVFKYIKENFREYSLPDGYFEYTEKGFYEKVKMMSFICIKTLLLLTFGKNCKWERNRLVLFLDKHAFEVSWNFISKLNLSTIQLV